MRIRIITAAVVAAGALAAGGAIEDRRRLSRRSWAAR